MKGWLGSVFEFNFELVCRASLIDMFCFVQDDFRPILRELLLSHHGLEFLHDTAEFQDRYGNIRYYPSRNIASRILKVAPGLLYQRLPLKSSYCWSFISQIFATIHSFLVFHRCCVFQFCV